MKGFIIKALSEKGEKVLHEDLRSNKRVFHVIELCPDPLEIKFLFRARAFTFFKLLRENDLKRHVCEKLEELGGKEGEDYDFQVIK